MATKYKLQDIAQLNGRDVFLDANILIYLFWPTGQHLFENNYACVFSHLLRQNNKLYVDFLVISEVINRVVRIEHQKLNPAQKFKEFRNSQEGQDTLKDIYLIVKDEILSKLNVIGKAFNKQEIENSLIVDKLDFVDKAIVTLCKKNTLVLLTNDKDFKDSDLDILTCNPAILN